MNGQQNSCKSETMSRHVWSFGWYFLWVKFLFYGDICKWSWISPHMLPSVNHVSVQIIHLCLPTPLYPIWVPILKEGKQNMLSATEISQMPQFILIQEIKKKREDMILQLLWYYIYVKVLEDRFASEIKPTTTIKETTQLEITYKKTVCLN